MAAGVTLSRAQLEGFRDHMNVALVDSVEAMRARDALVIDGAVSGRGVNLDLLRRLEKAGPFGQGNPEPVFVLPEQRLTDTTRVGDAHLRNRLRSADGASIDAMAFRAVGGPLGEALLRGRGEVFHVAVRVSPNHFRGIERPQCVIVDLARAG